MGVKLYFALTIYDIGVLVLKKNVHVFSDHFSILYNFSVDTLTYPDLLKNAAVVLGHKSGPKDDINNYRPISNLPIVSKIFEKLTLRPWPDDQTLSGRLVCFHTKSVNKQNLVAKRSPDTGLRTQWPDSQFHGKI